MLKIKILIFCYYLIFQKLPTLISKTIKMITENENLLLKNLKNQTFHNGVKLKATQR